MMSVEETKTKLPSSSCDRFPSSHPASVRNEHFGDMIDDFATQAIQHHRASSYIFHLLIYWSVSIGQDGEPFESSIDEIICQALSSEEFESAE